MRRSFLTLQLLMILTVASASASSPEFDVRTLVGMCAPIPLTESGDFPETLESGDCVLGNGSRLDLWTFSGTRGEVIEVTVRPLSATFTRPVVTLTPLSAGDIVEPPFIGAGPAATLVYRLTSTGQWQIAVGTLDLFSSGAYVLHFYRYPQVPVPNGQFACIEQQLLCGQAATWTLSADSCRFSSGGKPYVMWSIYAVKDDRLQFLQTSSAFTPLAGLYDKDVKLIESSRRLDNRTASIDFFVPESGWYHFVTTAIEEQRGGDFGVELKCSRSGCIFPYLVEDIPNIQARKDQPVAIPFIAHAIGGFTATLSNHFSILATSTSSPIVTPPISRPETVVLNLDNACGGYTSNSFVITPTVAKRRAVGR